MSTDKESLKRVWRNVGNKKIPTLYMEDVNGNQLLEIKDKKAELTLVQAVVKDAKFVSDIIEKSDQTIKLKKSDKNKHIKFIENKINMFSSEDTTKFLLIIKKKKEKVGFVELTPTDEESTYVVADIFFENKSLEKENKLKVINLLKKTCEKYGLYDVLAIAKSSFNNTIIGEIIYSHPKLDIANNKEGSK